MKNNLLDQKGFLSLFTSSRFRYIHDVNKEAIKDRAHWTSHTMQKGTGRFLP